MQQRQEPSTRRTCRFTHEVGKIAVRSPGNPEVLDKGMRRPWELAVELLAMKPTLNSWKGGRIEKTVGIQIRY